MNKIGILGTGTWGIALARMLAKNNHSVTAWSAISKEISELKTTHRHPKLEYMDIPETIEFTTEIEKAVQDQDIILFAVPSVFVRSTAKQVAHYINPNQIVVDVAKGVEPHTLLTMSEVIKDEFKKEGITSDIPVVALSGPTHAEEVAKDLPTTIVSACEDLETAKIVQNIFNNSVMRVYTNTDVLGVELCGATKNIIALACGISKGLGFGDNATAALITRGMAEITRLGKAMGCVESTFFGLSGIGDLVVTATSDNSRNNRCGILIGKGVNVQDAIKQIGMVVEGVNALPATIELSKKYYVEMPITAAINLIINEDANPSEIVKELMGRELKTENFNSNNELDFEDKLIGRIREAGMKRVITYGTFDLLHYGHINLLRRAKALGDYLIVALSTDEFNWNSKQKKTYFPYEQRKQLLESIRYVDLVIPEENWDQKKTDMKEYHIDTFTMGDDWKGKFDFLKDEGVDVVYLPRTPEISSSKIKNDLYDANSVEETKTSHDDLDVNPGKIK